MGSCSHSWSCRKKAASQTPDRRRSARSQPATCQPQAQRVRSFMKKWIAVYTKPRHEKTLAQELEKKGIESYLPLLKERRKWSDRKKWVEFPLFR